MSRHAPFPRQALISRQALIYCLVASFAFAAPLPALAQEQPAATGERTGERAGERDITVLLLSETAERDVTPDVLKARLLVRSLGDTPAKAQNAVNTAMEKALRKVKAAGLATETTGYHSWEEQEHGQDGKPTGPLRWRAQQTLVVTGEAGAKLLETVAALQQDELMLQDLNYELSRGLRRSLEDELTREALARLRARAELAAGAVDRRFDGWRRIRVGETPDQMPVMRMQMAAGMARAKDMAPPVAEPGTRTVRLSVEGEARLR